MIVLTGASASGKTEVAKVLAAKYGITKVITTTTRPMRIHEVNGRDYFFVTKERFESMIQQGKFVEYTLYNNNYYGSQKDQIHPDKCIVIEAAGFNAYAKLDDPSIVTFFLEAGEEKRKDRMLFRGDKKEDVMKRLTLDRTAFDKSNFDRIDFVIDSDKQGVDEVADQIYSIYINELEKKNLK